MPRIIRIALIILLAPVAVVTFYWWGVRYYRAVI